MAFRAIFAAALAVVVAPLLFAAPASAQATRTWVSGVGDDANPCSRTAPCKTFAGAISKTAAGGEINCLDPGGFGGVTITKAMAIVCDYTEGGVLVAGTNGIVINAGAADIIFLSGLDIHGVGTGLSGINFLAGGALFVRNTTIRRFNGAPGVGINFNPSGAAELTVTNTTIADNGGVGISVVPPGVGSAKVTIEDSTISNNNNCIATNGGTGAINMTIDNVVCSGNTANGVALADVAGGITDVMIDNSVFSNNGTGLFVNGALATLRIGGSVITGNGTAVTLAGGAIASSFGDNQIEGNTAVGNVLPIIARK